MTRANVRRLKSSKTRTTQNQNGKRPNLPRTKMTKNEDEPKKSQNRKKIENSNSDRINRNNDGETSCINMRTKTRRQTSNQTHRDRPLKKRVNTKDTTKNETNRKL